MFSFSQISRWISIPLDPITVEDWLANFETFGPSEKPTEEDKQLETAYRIEQIREKQIDLPSKGLPVEVLLNGLEVAGLLEEDNYLLLVPTGKFPSGKIVLELQVILESEKVHKVTVASGDFLTIPVSSEGQIKLKIKSREGAKINNKTELTWEGTGKEKTIIDARRRPPPTWSGGCARDAPRSVCRGC